MEWYSTRCRGPVATGAKAGAIARSANQGVEMNVRFSPTHSIVTWKSREPVTMLRGKQRALIRARELAESTEQSLEVWKLERGMRREKLRVVRARAGNRQRVGRAARRKIRTRHEACASVAIEGLMLKNRSREEIDAANKYHTWCRGWRDGAGMRAMREDHLVHPTLGTTYSEAYAAGQAAARVMAEQASARFGYTPSILRTASTETNRTSEEMKEGEEQ